MLVDNPKLIPDICVRTNSGISFQQFRLEFCIVNVRTSFKFGNNFWGSVFNSFTLRKEKEKEKEEKEKEKEKGEGGRESEGEGEGGGEGKGGGGEGVKRRRRRREK